MQEKNPLKMRMINYNKYKYFSPMIETIRKGPKMSIYYKSNCEEQTTCTPTWKVHLGDLVSSQNPHINMEKDFITLIPSLVGIL